jgi:RNA polymerase sigma-70 factor (ECF subfamily)
MFREITFTDVKRAGLGNAAVEDAAAGFVMDEEAFRSFYERNARSVWAYLASVAGDRQMADDLLQETFYRFLRAGSEYESEEHRRNSLYRIATNLVRDARRRRITRPDPVIAGHDVEGLAGRPPADSDRATDLTRAMARLKPRERAMLWLAYAEGASHREIAGELGLAPASLKLLLFRARRKLADLLGGAR